MSDADARRVAELVERIKPLLAHQGAAVQGAVLADLLATWLAGHIAPDDEAATDAFREELLKDHIDAVRKLIPLNEVNIFARLYGARS